MVVLSSLPTATFILHPDAAIRYSFVNVLSFNIQGGDKRPLFSKELADEIPTFLQESLQPPPGGVIPYFAHSQ
jgi:hypothetical protein